MKKIACLVSGGGTNLQALIDASTAGEIPNGEICLVVSSNPSAYALTRANNAGIKNVTIDKKGISNIDFDNALCNLLLQENIDIIVLAGFLCIIGTRVLSSFKNRIINVHPALLPSFGGKGYYGLRVHKAALEYGVKVTGATVHFVSDVIDGGKIIMQKAVDVYPDDTAEILQKRVMQEAEWIILPKALELICKENL